MKKPLLLALTVLSFSCFAGMANAQSAAPSVAPTTTSTTAAKPHSASAQQNRMKDCAAKYHAENIPKNQYRSFMSTCMKKPGSTSAKASTAAPSTLPTATPTATITPTTPVTK